MKGKIYMKKITLLMILTSFFFSEGNLSGVTYFTYDDNFSLTRTYFTYKKAVSDDVSFKFQTDVGQVGSDDRWTAYLKKAQLDWEIGNGLKISMGMIGMNMFNVQEKTWGNRFVEKSAMDSEKFSSSADLGFSVNQKLGDILTINLMFTNGEGYKTSSVDDNNKVSIQLVYGEKRLDKKDGYNMGLVYSDLANDDNTGTEVTGLFGGYSSDGWRVGAEHNVQTIDELNPDDLSINQRKDDLISLYFNYSVNNNFSFFFRQDSYDFDVDMRGEDKKTSMFGFIFTPTKGLSICPHILRTESYTADLDFEEDETIAIDFQFKF